MKSYNHLFEIAISDEVLEAGLMCASRGKRNRAHVKKILDNKEKYTKKFKAWLEKGDYKILKHKAHVINDGFVLKQRVIIQPYFYPEQWVHNIVVKALQPLFMNGMYEFSCGSIPKRGVHYGRKYLEKFIRENNKEIKYVLKFDIHHFYQSINIDLLKEKFAKYIHDPKMLKLIYYVLDSNTAAFKDGQTLAGGLPIGFYTSQWFANWYLQDFDHFIKEKLKAKCYVRYMDDVVIFGKNKKELHKDLILIKKFLKEKDLSLKSNYQVFKFDYKDKNGKRRGRFIDFMGFKFYRDKTTLRGKIFIRACRKARKIGHKKNLNSFDASQILSYWGWFKHSNCFTAAQKYIKPFIDIVQCKNIMRKTYRRKNDSYLQNGSKPRLSGRQRCYKLAVGCLC